jgi:hypothetical protein
MMKIVFNCCLSRSSLAVSKFTISTFKVTNLIEIFAPTMAPVIFNIWSLFLESPLRGLDLAWGLGLGFYFNLFFIFFLNSVNVFLVLSHNIEELNKLKFGHSGAGGKDPKR